MNEQEKLWHGQFGTAYHERNQPTDRLDFWTDALRSVHQRIISAIEFGAGQGDNLAALRCLIPNGHLSGVEINPDAAAHMRRRKFHVINSSVHGIKQLVQRDLVLTRGFLIHVPPGELLSTYALMHRTAKKYICLAEYYSPQRRVVPYRGNENALWAADFAGELMQCYKDLKLIDYGFHYHLDGGDDLTWFLMEKAQEVKV